eukprot:Pompholyxophrys_sp_v1_NODE_1_length_32789_cov_6.460653.p33 type:complete len:108 gc:universal NODE_1_length_32789_cov_6.460653:26198-25875(-)
MISDKWCTNVQTWGYHCFPTSQLECKCDKLHPEQHERYAIALVSEEGDETALFGSFWSIEQAKEEIPRILKRNPDTHYVHVFKVTEMPVASFDRNMNRIDFKVPSFT